MIPDDVCVVLMLSKLGDVSDALSSFHISSTAIPYELCIEGTKYVSYCFHLSIIHSLTYSHTQSVDKINQS